MAQARVTIVAAPHQHGHKRAIVKSGNKRIVLRCTSPKVDHSGLAGDWKQVPRGGDRPLLGMAGRQLHVAKVTAIIARDDGSAVEDILVDLINISRDGNDDHKVTLAHYGYLEAGPWRLTDISIISDQRKFGTNQITRADVTLTLTEHVAEPGPSAAKKKKHKAGGGKSGSGDGGQRSKPRTYTVRAGDTLSRIAVKFYGDANRWHRIARANHLRDPNHIYPGQRLKIP